MNEGPFAGIDAVPSRHGEPIVNWCKLSKGDNVDIYRGRELVTSGRIDVLAHDGSVLWITQDQGRGRSLFLYNDGFDIKRQTDQTRPRRAVMSGNNPPDLSDYSVWGARAVGFTAPYPNGWDQTIVAYDGPPARRLGSTS